jgi:predicted dehydrogenase
MAIEGRNDGAQRRVRLGMVGGGEGAFIGAVHRIAARLDDHFELLAGALSSEPARAKRSGGALGLDPARVYGSFEEMAHAEAKHPNGIEAVAIVTPNHMHAPVATAFLQAGIHVICDKPLTATLAEAKSLADLARKSGRVFAVTYNYSGYPMVRQARAMVADGTLGTIRVVQVEYPQDWLTERIETTGHKQAEWRTDPQRTGAGGSIGDIGTHAFHLASFVSGLELDSLLADLTTFVPGRQVDDNANVLLRFKGGAKGMLWASQVAPGNENALQLRIYGTKGGLTWSQENPNYLRYAPFQEAPRMLSRGGPGIGAAAARVTRVPPGHPEGYLEGFASIYSEAAAAIRAVGEKKPVPPEVLFPTVEDGLKGVSFVDAVVRSSRDGGVWTKPA